MSEVLKVTGGKKLKGTIKVSGSKNAVLPIMAATILTDDECVVSNVPDLSDVRVMNDVIKSLGGKIEIKNGVLKSKNNDIKSFRAPYELVRTMRASIYVMGSLLGKYGYAEVSLPGGCVIGDRPINLHLSGFEKMGAKVTIEHGYIKAEAKKLKGADIYLDVVSVGATANLMLAAVLAEGKTIIRNAASEPHIVDLGNFLNKMGAKVSGHGTKEIKITGVKNLHGCEYSVVADYIEAGTFLILSAMNGGGIVVDGAPAEDIEIVISKLKEAGFNVKNDKGGLVVEGLKRPKSVDIETLPYPGFPTDLQSQWMVLMTIADGASIIRETIWENRFMHVPELNRMGADIKIEGNIAVVRGVEKLNSAPVMASDLRAGVALVMAALAADGETIIDRIYHIDRGYEKIVEKLSALGADIKKIKI